MRIFNVSFECLHVTMSLQEQLLMGVTNYYTIDGQMIGYKDANGRKDFLTDNLGSVTAEIDQTGTNRTFDGRYRPYGNSLWSTGTRGSFGWVGTWGYRETGLSSSTHYVRARHYSQVSGMWTTGDPTWPEELAYQYSANRPELVFDDTGLSPTGPKLRKVTKKIGCVPKGQQCKPGSDGTTGCDPHKGCIWTVICNPSCDAKCTGLHEQKHRKDMYQCCAAFAKCIANYNANMCKTKYRNWLNGNDGWLECRAHEIGYQCRVKMYSAKCCEKKPGDECCKKLRDGESIDKEQMDIKCQGVVTSSSPPVQCPFDKNGKPK